MNGLIFRFINWYAVRFRFPTKGLKYFIAFLSKRKLLAKTYLTKNKDGILFNINLNDHIQRIIFWYGSYEPVELGIFKKLLSAGNIVFDVGANVGNYALTASNIIGKNGVIHCFEASAGTVLQLKKNILLNHLDNIQVHQAAVADKPGNASLYLSCSDNIGMTSLRPAENFSAVVEAVNIITIDNFIKTENIPYVSVVKIDIEGCELLALQGMQQLLFHHQPIILVEVNAETLMRFDTTPATIYNFLNGFNYKPYQMIDADTLKPVEDFTTEASLILFAIQKHKIDVIFKIQKSDLRF